MQNDVLGEIVVGKKFRCTINTSASSDSIRTFLGLNAAGIIQISFADSINLLFLARDRHWEKNQNKVIEVTIGQNFSMYRTTRLGLVLGGCMEKIEPVINE